MNFCGSSLPQIWAIEALACSNHVEPSLLIDLLKKTPQISNDTGANARELVSLKLLESLFKARANPESPTLSKTVRLDPSYNCEDALQQILSEKSLSHLKHTEPEMSKWDLEPFIEHKRSNLPKYSLKQLKDAILMGSRSISAYLKEKSGLPVTNHAEDQAPEKDGNCNGITPRVDGSDTNYGNLLPMDLSDENLVTDNRKRRVSGSPAEQLCTTYINPNKKNKHDAISNEQFGFGQLTSLVSMQQIEAKRSGIERKTNVGDMGLLQSSKHDTSGCISSELDKPNDVLPCGGQLLLHCDDIELNYNSKEQQMQDQNIEEDAGENEAPGLEKTNEDTNTFAVCAKNVDEVEENILVSDDQVGNYDGKTNIGRKKKATEQYGNSQDSLEETNSRHQILLANTSKKYVEESSRVEEQTCVEVIMQNVFSGAKELVGNGHVLPHCGIEVPHEKSDAAMLNSKGENTESERKCLHGPLTNEDIDKFYRNDARTIPTVGEAEEDVDISSDNDAYHDERTNIDAKKKTFLSSQSTYSQATTDSRELSLCMKCNNGGDLLSCSSDSCTIVIHESCLGSDGSFDTRETFYCPFCAYSRAISKYMEVKKCTSLARKDLTAFICFGPQNETNKQAWSSFRVDGNCSKQNDESTDRIVRSSKRDKQDGKRIRQKFWSRRGHRQQPITAEAVHHFQSETTTSRVSETSGSEKHADVRPIRGVPHRPETDLPCEHKGSQSSQERSEDSGASRFIISVRKQERENLYPGIPQSRKKRLHWTSEEEDTLKNGVHIFCSHRDRIIHWKKILKFGEGIFHPSRSTVDLKDKWKDMRKAIQTSK